jgi:hypothetical protein
VGIRLAGRGNKGLAGRKAMKNRKHEFQIGKNAESVWEKAINAFEAQ